MHQYVGKHKLKLKMRYYFSCPRVAKIKKDRQL